MEEMGDYPCGDTKEEDEEQRCKKKRGADKQKVLLLVEKDITVHPHDSW